MNFDSPAELTVAASSIAYEKDCNDVIIPNEKNRLEYKLENSTDVDGYTSGKGTLLAPFSLFSSSVSTGYVSDIASNFREKTEIDNYHNDSYGDDKGIPLQGPFTEKHVGGAQHRHIDLNTSRLGIYPWHSAPLLFLREVLTNPGQYIFEMNMPNAQSTYAILNGAQTLQL